MTESEHWKAHLKSRSVEELHGIAWNPNADPEARAAASELLRTKAPPSQPPALEPLANQMQSITPEDLYVEYRRWKPFWGLLVDSQAEVNALIREQNSFGFKTVAFHHHNGVVPNLSIFRLILVVAVQILTLGFFSYYIGPSFIFTRAGTVK